MPHGLIAHLGLRADDQMIFGFGGLSHLQAEGFVVSIWKQEP